MAQLVYECTNQDLIEPDWTKNMELCDRVNQGDNDFKKEIVDELAKRLDGKNPKIVSLALTLLESLEKNCVYSFHKLIHDKDFLNNIFQIAVGTRFTENAEQAQKLIQELALSYLPYKKEFRLFGSMYKTLINRSIEFPEEESVSIFDPVLSENAKAVSDYGQKGNIRFTNPNAKIEHELHEILDGEEDYCAQFLVRIVELLASPDASKITSSSIDLCKLLKESLIQLLLAYKKPEIDVSTIQIYPGETIQQESDSEEDLIDIDAPETKKEEDEDEDSEVDFEDLFK
ncbi:hypothetical protein WA158_000336 [Blastocystis sp. Blastoise]